MMPSISPIPDRMLAGHLLRERVAAVLREDRHGHLDPAQRVPDLVGHARRHLAERRERLPLDQPPLGLHLLGEVAEHAHGAHDLPARVDDRRDGEVRGKIPRGSRPHPDLPLPGVGAAERLARRGARTGPFRGDPTECAPASSACEAPKRRSPAGFMVTRRPLVSVGEDAVVHALHHARPAAARRAAPPPPSSGATGCISWNDATRRSASSFEIVNRSSTIMRAAAAPERRGEQALLETDADLEELGHARARWGGLAPNSSPVMTRRLRIAHVVVDEALDLRGREDARRRAWSWRARKRPGRPPPGAAPRRPDGWPATRRRSRPSSPNSDQKSPWLSESSPARPRQPVGRSQAWPNGPDRRGVDGTHHAFLHERRDDQRVEPQDEAGRDARDGAAPVAAPPVRARAGWPARTGSPRRTTAAPSRPAGSCPAASDAQP